MPHNSQREEFLVVLGLSRSGTTLLTALLHANPEIELRFEAWHSVQPRPPFFLSLDEFDSFYRKIRPTKKPLAKILGFKETLGEIETLEWIEHVLKSIHLPIKIIVIVRDIAEAYLSDISAYKKYWGKPDSTPCSEYFRTSHFPESYKKLTRLIKLQQHYDGALVSYKSLTLAPNIILSGLSSAIKIPYLNSQLDFYKTLDRSEIMGDPGLTINPQPISSEISIKRTVEAEDFLKTIPDFLQTTNYLAFKRLVDFVDKNGFTIKIPFNDF